MTEVRLAPRHAIVDLSPKEVVIIANALNEVCNGLDVAEFSLRIGASRDQALRLLADMKSLADQLKS